MILVLAKKIVVFRMRKYLKGKFIIYSIYMTSLGNPKKYTTNLKRKNGGSTVQELEFKNFKKNGRHVHALRKEDVDELVRAEVKKILQEEGPSYISVSYVSDMPYSTGFRLFDKASDE